MRLFRRTFIIAASLTAGGALCAPAAFATPSAWAKGGQPTCTVAVGSPATSSTTTCTGTLNGAVGVQLSVNLDVSGIAVYQCEDSTGATVPGQTQVQAPGGSITPFTPTKKNETFTTGPADLAAPAVSASQAGCAAGTTAVDPTLTTIKIQLLIGSVGDGPFLISCATDRNGLSGTVALTGC